MASLVSECHVKPKYEGGESKQTHYLGPDDLIMMSIHYMQKGLLFTKPPNFDETDMNSLLEKLKKTLSLALVHFYPLAGRLETNKYEDEHRCWIYVDCNKGFGARFIHAMVNKTLFDITMSTPDIILVVRSFFELGETGVVNHDGHSRALLSVQVTELIGGIFIGFTMNHAIADGTSLWHFITTLSEIYTSLDEVDDKLLIPEISHIPIFRPFYWGEIDPVIKLPYLDPDEFITRLNNKSIKVREKNFHFSAATMITLKTLTNAECSNGVHNISAFQSLCALVWKSITKARKLPPDDETTCSLIVNTRPRLDPPMSMCHFGNFGSMAQGKCKVREMLGSGLGWAALLLHQAVGSQDDKAARSALKAYIKAPFVAQPGWASSVFGSHPIVVGGSPRFDMYGPEFGLGRAIAVWAGYANKPEGKVTANPGCERSGSVDLEICLAPETITNLELDEEFMSYVS